MLNKQGRKQIIYWVILGCAVFMRIIAFAGSDNFHGIAAGKIMEARRILEHPNELTAWIVPAHGPAHLYLVALGLKTSNNHYNSACILSLLFGIGVLLPYTLFVKTAFDDKTAICSSFIVAFFPLHVVYSVLSTAETMFLFFLFSGLFFFVKEKKNGRLIDLFLSALFLSISTVCRFEGGLFIIIVTLLLARNLKKAVFFMLVSSVLPIAWMWGNYLVSGNFMQFLFASDNIVKTEFHFQRSLGIHLGFFEKFFYWIFILKSYFSWPVFAVACWGFIEYGFRKKYRDAGLIFLSTLVFFSYKTLAEELAMQPRYGMSLGLLFLPFFSLKLIEILKQVKKRSRIIILIGFILYVIFRCAYLQIYMLPRAPYWIKQTALFLRHNVKDGQTIYIETDEDNIKAPLKIYTRLKPEQFIDYNPFAQDVELLNENGLKKLKFIVLISQRKLKNLKEVFRINSCKIYDLENYEK